MKITCVEDYLPRRYQIKFGDSEQAKTEAVEAESASEDKDTFYSRNKKALIALGAIGVAGIAAAGIYRHIKLSKLGGSHSSLSDGEVGSLSLYSKFREDLKAAGDENAVDSIIKNAFNHPDKKFCLDVATDVAYSDRINKKNYINLNTWESIVDGIMNITPAEKINQEKIFSGLDNILMGMGQKELFRPEIIDKLIGKMANASEEMKVIIAKRLISSHLKLNDNLELIDSQLKPEQVKRVAGILSGIKSDTIRTSADEFGEYNIPKLLFDYHLKYFKDSQFSETYVADFEEVLSRSRLTQDAKLQLIAKLQEEYKLGENAGFNSEFQKQAVYTALKTVANAQADTYTADKLMVEYFGAGNKFVLGQKLLKLVPNFIEGIPGAERINIIDNLIMSAERLQKNGKIKISRGEYCDSFTNLLRDKIQTKRGMIVDKFKKTGSYDEINKSIDDIKQDIAQMNSDYADWGIGVKSLTESEYDSFIYYIECEFKVKRSGVVDELPQEKEIWKKINDFGKKTFGGFWRNRYHNSPGRYEDSSYKQSSNSSRSGGWRADTGFSSAKASAKALLIKYLREKKEFAEVADQLENQTLNVDLFKSVKRKLSLAYHPDRAAKDEKLAQEYTEKFKEISNALDILEKGLG